MTIFLDNEVKMRLPSDKRKIYHDTRRSSKVDNCITCQITPSEQVDLTIHVRELLQDVRADRRGLDLILESVEKSLQMTSKTNLFPRFHGSIDRTCMLTEDNECHAIRELRAEVND